MSPVFRYDLYESPFANTIAQLIAHQNDPMAQAARIKGDLQARAIEGQGQAASDMIRGFVNIGQNAMSNILEAQRQAPITAMNKIRLEDTQRAQQADRLMATAGSEPGGPNFVGPMLPGAAAPTPAMGGMTTVPPIAGGPPAPSSGLSPSSFQDETGL